MPTLPTTGRFLYALALISLGVKMLIVGRFPADLMPLSATIPGGFALPYLAGIVLLVAGVGLAALIQTRMAALAAGAFLVLFGLIAHMPRILVNPMNPGPWTPFFELLAMGAGALVLAGLFSSSSFRSAPGGPALIRWGKGLFIASLLAFSGLHFYYASFIATLITAWIPGHLFWAYFVGIAFLASAISLLINRYVWLSSTLLGVMFLLWVLVLHAPRALAKPHVEPEWTSLLIALAMSGIAFVLSDTQTTKTTSVNRLAEVAQRP